MRRRDWILFDGCLALFCLDQYAKSGTFGSMGYEGMEGEMGFVLRVYICMERVERKGGKGSGLFL